jgi:hypothetical protein
MGGRHGLDGALVSLSSEQERACKGRSMTGPCCVPRMHPHTVEGQRVRVGFRTLISLALCAAAAGAALAHCAIDVVGDYALTSDSYDNLRHGSRELMTAVALLLAVVLAARGLRVCCEIAADNRARLIAPVLRLREICGILIGAVGACAAIVPAMEYLDGRLDGIPVRHLSDALGGSIPLGLGMTLFCATLIAAGVCAVARWLVSHRDSIATIIETLLRPVAGAARPATYDLIAQLVRPRRRRRTPALCLSKRGPPEIRFA